ncbi:MAG: hypothetical protein JXX14_14965 [Deltaproteobacteria bacterium]|nr:hypothetical protein [Deltaproteobacteria bacterium]
MFNDMRVMRVFAVLVSLLSWSCVEDCACTAMDCLDGINVSVSLPQSNDDIETDSYKLLWREKNGVFAEVEPDIVSAGTISWNIDYYRLSGRIDEIELRLLYNEEIIVSEPARGLVWESFECNDCTGGCKDIQYRALVELSTE